MALRLFQRTEIRHHLLRLHNNLPQQQNTGANDLADNTHHADDRVHLRQVPALGIQLLPDIRNRINAHNINAPVGKIEEIVHHFVEYPGIFIVQIPLIRVKGRHYKMLCILQPCEISRRSSRKYLRHRPVIERRQIRIVKKEVPAHVLALAGARPLCPLVVL